MHEPFYVLGAGNTARDAIAVLDALGRLGDVRGFVQEGPVAPGQRLHGIPVMTVAEMQAKAPKAVLADGIGSPLRERLVRSLEEQGHRFVTLVHPHANVHPMARIGEGSLVHAGVAVGAGVEVGPHVLLNWNCLIGHDTTVEAFAHVSGTATLGAGARIGRGSMIGLSAVVLAHVTVGAGSMVGAGSLVTRDVPPGVVAFGSPARAQRKLDPADWPGLLAGRPAATS